jgi:hypothetical protein
VAIVAATVIVLANVMIALMIFNNESYEYKSWHVTLLMWAQIVFLLIWNLYFRKLINTIEIIGAVSVFVFFIVSVAVLAALAQKSTSKFVFTTLTHDLSGWNDPTICLGIGVLTAAVSLVGELADWKPVVIISLIYTNWEL